MLALSVSAQGAEEMDAPDWLQLPYAVWHHVLQLTPVQAVCSFGQTCSRAKQLCIDDGGVWRRRCADLGVGSDLRPWRVDTYLQLYRNLLHRYGPLLGLWQGDVPGVGALLRVRLEPPYIVGSTVVINQLEGTFGTRPVLRIGPAAASAAGSNARSDGGGVANGGGHGGGRSRPACVCLRVGRARPDSSDCTHSAHVDIRWDSGSGCGGGDGGEGGGQRGQVEGAAPGSGRTKRGGIRGFELSCVDGCRHELWELYGRLLPAADIIIASNSSNPSSEQQQQRRRRPLPLLRERGHASFLYQASALGAVIRSAAAAGDGFFGPNVRGIRPEDYFTTNAVRFERFIPPKLSCRRHPLEGLWKGTYGEHGIELLRIELRQTAAAAVAAVGTQATRGEEEEEAGVGMLSSAARRRREEEEEGDGAAASALLVAVKVLGDVNVPSGQVSFQIHAPPTAAVAGDGASPGARVRCIDFAQSQQQQQRWVLSRSGAAPFSLPEGDSGVVSTDVGDLSDPGLGGRFDSVLALCPGQGRVALPGFRQPEWTPVQAAVFDEDCFGLTWLEHNMFSLFVRVEL